MILPRIEPPAPLRIWRESSAFGRFVEDTARGFYHVEPKRNGWRCLVYVDERGIRFVSRHDGPLGDVVPLAVKAWAAELPQGTVIDGEILTERRAGGRAAGETGQYYAFDAPFWAGKDLRAFPIEGRRVRVWDVQRDGVVIVPAWGKVPLGQAYDDAVAAGHEGLVLKRAEAPYGLGWIKIRRRGS